MRPSLVRVRGTKCTVPGALRRGLCQCRRVLRPVLAGHSRVLAGTHRRPTAAEYSRCVLPPREYSRRYRSGTGVRGCCSMAEGRACRAVVHRRVRVRCRGQQRVPGGLRADRGRGGVPHRRRRRGQDLWVDFFSGLRLPAGLLHLDHRQHCVLQPPPGRRRRSFLPAAVRRHQRCAATRTARQCGPESGVCGAALLPLCACAASGTPAPTNPGGTNPPTRSPTTSVLTLAPTFAPSRGPTSSPNAPGGASQAHSKHRNLPRGYS